MATLEEMKEDMGDRWLGVPCPDCYAHTGEKCKPVGERTQHSAEVFGRGHVHREREAQAKRAMQSTI